MSALLASCWHGEPAPAPERPRPQKARVMRVPTERAIALSQQPGALADRLSQEMRTISPAAYVREHVVFDDAITEPAYQVLPAKRAMLAIGAYEHVLSDPSRVSPICRHDTERMYTCTQPGNPLVIMQFCRIGDWDLVGFFVGQPGDPTSRQRYLTFAKVMQNGC